MTRWRVTYVEASDTDPQKTVYAITVEAASAEAARRHVAADYRLAVREVRELGHLVRVQP